MPFHFPFIYQNTNGKKVADYLSIIRHFSGSIFSWSKQSIDSAKWLGFWRFIVENKTVELGTLLVNLR